MDELQRLQKEKEKENSQQIKKLIQIIDDKDQLMKDNETKFINKLKQQEKQFMDIIDELRENQNDLGLKYRQDNEKLNSEVNNLKRQLKMVQKEFEDFKEGQSFMALSPSIVHTKSVVDYNNFQTTSKKNDETLLKNSFSVLETMEDEQIANSHTPIEEIPQTDKPSKNSSSKNIQNPKIDTGKEFKSSTTSETHIRPQTYQNERSTNGPILILCDSMYSGIKEMKLSSKTYINKQCVRGGKIADLIKIATDLNDSITYSRVLIHVGTNNIFNTTEQEIIKEISKLVTIIKQKWPNTEIVYSSIILHKTNSRKNIIINNLNQEIKQLSIKFPFRFMDNTNVALLPSGHIDNEAFFDNLHLNNEKRSRILANNIKIFLGLKSKREQRQQRPSTNEERRQPKKSYAEIVSRQPRSSTEPFHSIMYQTSSNIHGNIPNQQIDSQLQPVISTEQLIKATQPIAELFNTFTQNK